MKKILRFLNNYRVSRSVRNTFDFPKLSKAQYESIKGRCEILCNKIINEIVAVKKDNDFVFSHQKTQINNFEIISKFGDWLGPVIKKNGKYYRCVKKESIEKFTNLWNSGILEVFSKKGYIPKLSLSEYYSEEYPIILEQESLEIMDVTKMTLEQAKKGLLFVSMLQYICKKNGFALIDPHYFNYTFSKQHFIYYDLGSFSTIGDYSKYRDFSMVVLGAYRILFSFFPDSVLSKRDLGNFRDGVDVSYKTDYFEFIFYKNETYRYCRRHCSKIILNAFRKIFDNYECAPWDIIICFMSDRIGEVDNLLKEIM